VLRHFGDLWKNLSRSTTCPRFSTSICSQFLLRRTVANNGNFLVLQVIGPVPSRRVHFLSCKVIDAFNLRPLGLIQLSNGTDKEITDDLVLWIEFGILAAFGCRDMYSPLLRLVIPGSILYTSIEADVLVEPVLLCSFHDVS
jgi:hypothetical protein